MTRPKPPRLPELGGMTEAGFNRVVAMIQPWDFHHRRRCNTPWGYSGFTYCDECRRAKQRFDEWRASLPKTRNKKQRKKAKRAAFEAVLDGLPEVSGMLAARESFFGLAKSVPVVDGPLASRPDLLQTPLQRLQQFAADTGVPVSFEIAEKAMKGGE
jgi:hypothetical protein